MGEARDGARTGIEAFRTALRRLFLGFQLVPNGTFPFATGMDGIGWPRDDSHPELELDGYALWPAVRREAFDLDSFAPRKATLGLDPSGSATGIQRSKLALSDLDDIGLLM
jgi:hypothetical protein